MASITDSAGFRYESLDPDAGQFRLVQILPAEDGTLQLTMRVAKIPVSSEASLHTSMSTPTHHEAADRLPGSQSRSPAPKVTFNDYRCLSYCWGIESANKLVRILDQDRGLEGELSIRPNLYSFLRHRLDRCLHNAAEKQSWWWIDALCINQEDIDERAEQVRHMGSIYQYASGVYIWLGLGPYGDLILAKLASSKRCCAEELAALLPIEAGRPRRPNVYELPDLHTMLIDRRWPILEREWSLVKDLPSDRADSEFNFYVSNLYWRRLWVIQEMALCQNLYVILPDCDLSASCFKSCLEILGVLHDELDSHQNRGQSTRTLTQRFSNTMFSVRDRFLEERSRHPRARIPVPELLDILYTLGPLSSNGLDQVFGNAAIGDFDLERIPIDYDMTGWQLFMQLVNSEAGRAEHYRYWFTLLDRLDVDLCGEVDEHLNNVNSHPGTLLVRLTPTRGSLEVLDKTHSSIINFDIMQNWISTNFGEVDEKHIFTVDFSIMAGQMIFYVDGHGMTHPIGLVYRQLGDTLELDLLRRSEYVSFEPGDIVSCSSTRDKALVVDLTLSEWLVLRMRYWYANKEDERARRLVGIHDLPAGDLMSRKSSQLYAGPPTRSQAYGLDPAITWNWQPSKQ